MSPPNLGSVFTPFCFLLIAYMGRTNGQMDGWSERQQCKGNMQNHTTALTADIHNSALSLIGNKKYEHQT